MLANCYMLTRALSALQIVVACFSPPTRDADEWLRLGFGLAVLNFLTYERGFA